MAFSWNPPTDLELAHKAPVKLDHPRRIRDMIRALAEGASGADRVLPGALDLWLGSIDWSGTTYAGLTGLDGLDALLVFYRYTPGVNTAQMRFRLTGDNGANWGGANNFGLTANASSNSGQGITGYSIIGLKTAKAWTSQAEASGAGQQANVGGGRVTGYTIPGSGANGIQFSMTAGGGSGSSEVFGIGTFA
jgi:hypothetical protein